QLITGGRGLLGGRDIAIGTDHLRTVGGQRQRALPADPAAGSDHQRPLAVQPEQCRVTRQSGRELILIGHDHRPFLVRMTAIRVTVSSSIANRGPSRPAPESFTPPYGITSERKPGTSL